MLTKDSDRSEFTLASMACACALVKGPSVAGASMVMSVGCSASSPPPLGKILPRIKIFITMVRCKVGDVEGVAHRVLVRRNVHRVCIVVYLGENLEWAIGVWEE